MSKLLKKLPKSIIIKIFEYDMTFKKIVYEKLLNEFLKKMNFWKLIWINKDEDYSGYIEEEDKHDLKLFESTYKQVIQLYNFWNNIYPSRYCCLSTNYNCSIEFITDELISSKYLMKKLKNN
tara:strand:+ start:102 stop:467 length:366 start_codon:yes stop_codon:yes gene_type:complete